MGLCRATQHRPRPGPRLCPLRLQPPWRPRLLAALKRVIQKWKPAASSCRYIEAWLRVDLFGNPLEIVRFPVWEDWELDASGNARDYFNTGYLP